MNWGAEIADRYLAPSVPQLEYPRSDLPETVEFVGPFLPGSAASWTPPEWWDDVLPPKLRPSNVRMAPFAPFGELLPMVDCFVTNGGYGVVQPALANGVPLVVAGATEDKIEVAARVTWAGVGIALDTDTPSSEQARACVSTVLSRPSYRVQARERQRAYARLPRGDPGGRGDPEMARTAQPAG